VGDLGCRLGLRICGIYLVRIWHAIEMIIYIYIYWEPGGIHGFASNINVEHTGFGFEDDGLIE
jgi:hypothetical protein